MLLYNLSVSFYVNANKQVTRARRERLIFYFECYTSTHTHPWKTVLDDRRVVETLAEKRFKSIKKTTERWMHAFSMPWCWCGLHFIFAFLNFFFTIFISVPRRRTSLFIANVRNSASTISDAQSNERNGAHRQRICILINYYFFRCTQKKMHSAALNLCTISGKLCQFPSMLFLIVAEVGATLHCTSNQSIGLCCGCKHSVVLQFYRFPMASLRVKKYAEFFLGGNFRAITL